MTQTIIATHAGTAHRDDFIACSLLINKYNDAKIIRTDDQEIINSAHIVVDAGLVYDPQRKRYDHHQNIELPASFVLILRDEFGITTLTQQLQFVDLADRFGLVKAMANTNVQPIIGILESAVIDMFSQSSEIDSSSPLWSVMLHVGDFVLREIRKYDEYKNAKYHYISNRSDELDPEAFNIFLDGNKAIIISNTQFSIDTMTLVMAEFGVKCVGVIKPNQRSKYYEFVSINNNKQFVPTEQKLYDVLFEHKNKFMVVVKATWDDIKRDFWEIIRQIYH